MDKKKTLWGPKHRESDLKTITLSRKTGSYDDFPGFSWTSDLPPSSLWESWISFWPGLARIIKELPLLEDKEPDYFGVNSPVRFPVGDSPLWRGGKCGRSHFYANEGLFEETSLLIWNSLLWGWRTTEEKSRLSRAHLAAESPTAWAQALWSRQKQPNTLLSYL